MTAILERRSAPAAPWARRLGSFSAVLFLTAALAHRFALIETVPFLWLLGIVGFLAFCGLCLAIVALVQIWERGVAGLNAASLGAVFSALVLVPYAVSGYRIVIHPQLMDISTDISRPPRFEAAAALRAPPMNRLGAISQDDALLQADAYPDVAGRRYEHARSVVVDTVLELVESRGWRLLSPMPAGDGTGDVTIEAVGRSYLLGFPSDVAIRIEERWNATYVDMRSASRYGRHDMGENAERIRRFLNDLDRRMERLGS
ncbi:DUF1499 domain-containing protein [Chelativorans sp. M5D2P16]|uniref:DUF1499 domain-containing protein n=1 Tax=Chelativorans sp. M5D2P16 TaxID=3095678 RepID=UPI002ACAAE27|nr:DUF1499 domain-containing protein [Chelativorans sp. M5D2P16]MDZ5698803.1 DUF1499 domain-containing protein [Chelativorans sp. M5D2P16]